MATIKDQAPCADRVTLVLRAAEGHSLAEARDHLRQGKKALGVLEVAALSDGDALARLEALDDPASPVHSAVALLEHAADKFEAAGDERNAKQYREVAVQIRQIIGVPKPGQMGLDALSPCRSSSAIERAEDLLLAVERAARRVIQNELECDGLIARAITGRKS